MRRTPAPYQRPIGTRPPAAAWSSAALLVVRPPETAIGEPEEATLACRVVGGITGWVGRGRTRSIGGRRLGDAARRRGAPRCSTAGSGIDHQFAGRHVQRVGDVVEPLEEQTPPAVLDTVEDRASDTRKVCQLFLGKASLDAQFADPLADRCSTTLPSSHALRTVLARTRGHAH